MTEVLIAGIGQTPVQEHWEVSLRELAFTAVKRALENAGGLHPQALFVGNMLAAQLTHQAHLGALIADFAGLAGIEASTIEAADASGGAALRAAYLAILSGEVDVALAVGVEKFSDQVGSPVETALASSLDSDYEAVHGLTPAAQAAMLMRRYMYTFEVPREAFAGFALTAHAHGEGNPNAMFRKAISLETYQRAAIVTDPLNMFDIAPNADGAAAVVLCRAEVLPRPAPQPVVRIRASSLITDTLALHDRPDPLVFHAARLSVRRACQKAGIELSEIDLFELHDAYSIYAALALEAAGFAPPGEGWKLVQVRDEGTSEKGGIIPICTMGGLKARGHPGGATGVYQAVEATLQLRGQAGKAQIPQARLAMIQSLGGPAATAVTHILEALD